MSTDSKAFLLVENMSPKYLMPLYNSSKKVVKVPKKVLITNFETLQRDAKDNSIYYLMDSGRKIFLHKRLVRKCVKKTIALVLFKMSGKPFMWKLNLKCSKSIIETKE